MVSTVGVEIADSECAPSAEMASRVWAPDGGTGASGGGGRARASDEPDSELDAAPDTVIEYMALSTPVQHQLQLDGACAYRD